MIKRKMPDGVAILAFLIFFSAFRWFNYYLRVPPATFDAPALFYPGYYLTLIVGSAGLMVWRMKKGNR